MPRYIVCLKQVPDTTEVEIDLQTGTLKRSGLPSVVNPFDLNAIGMALSIRKRTGGEIIAVSLGPPQAETALREALALGVDKAVLITDPIFAGSDTLATSRILATAIKKLFPVDIIFTGRQAIDGDTGQVGAQIASFLNLPFIPYVSDIFEVSDSSRFISIIDGKITEYRVSSFPLVLSVNRDINFSPKSSLRDWVFSYKKPFLKWDNKVLQLSSEEVGLRGSPTRVRKIDTLKRKKQVKFIEGSIREKVQKLFEIINISTSYQQQKVSLDFSQIAPVSKDTIIGICADEEKLLELSSLVSYLAYKGKMKSAIFFIGESLSISSFPIDLIYHLKLCFIEKYDFLSLANVVYRILNKENIKMIVSLAGEWERALMPLLSAKFSTGLTADCTSVDIDDGEFFQVRPAWGGNILATIVTPDRFPKMATIREGIYKDRYVFKNYPQPIIKTVVSCDDKIKSIEKINFLGGENRKVDNSNTSLVIGGGRGIGKKENFSLLFEVANILGGSVAGSRVAVEKGWIDYQYQVGQTGRVIQPDIYIACGISGAIQHLIGVQNAKMLIAINKDPDAPIFKFSDYGIVEDYRIILENLKKLLGKKVD